MKRMNGLDHSEKTACQCQEKSFPDHVGELARVNRALGQLEGVKRMIGERRYCVDILQQLRAIRYAVKAVEVNILKRHLDACVAESFADKVERDQKIEEIKELLVRF